MSEKRTPRPGDIWRYTIPAVGDRVGVVGATGRATMIDGDNNIPRDARPVELIGYRAWCVDLLRSELEAGRDDPIDWNATCFLNEIAEREPWRVLREVDKLIRGHWNFDGNDSGRLMALADELEREHCEAAKRDRLVEKLADILGDFAVADEHSGERDDVQLARLLVGRGVTLAEAGRDD